MKLRLFLGLGDTTLRQVARILDSPRTGAAFSYGIFSLLFKLSPFVEYGFGNFYGRSSLECSDSFHKVRIVGPLSACRIEMKHIVS